MEVFGNEIGIGMGMGMGMGIGMDEEKAELDRRIDRIARLPKTQPGERKRAKDSKGNNLILYPPQLVATLQQSLIPAYQNLEENDRRKGYLLGNIFYKLNAFVRKNIHWSEEVSPHLLTVMYATAMEIYLRKSFFLYEEFLQLKNIIVQEQDQEQEQHQEQDQEQDPGGDKDPHTHLQTDLDMDKDKNLFQANKKRKIRESFCLQAALNLKYLIMKKFLPFYSPAYNASYAPPILIRLMSCQTKEHFQNKSFLDALENFLTVKLNSGHFMNGCFGNNLSQELWQITERKRLKRERDMALMENIMRKDNKLFVMSQLLSIFSEDAPETMIKEKLTLAIERATLS